MRIFIAGYGFLGREIARMARSQGATVQTCSRSQLSEPDHLPIDLASSEIEQVKECDLGVFCATSGPGQDYQSTYIKLQENIIRRLQTRIKHYVFISSTRVYGQVDAEVDEETTIHTSTDEKTQALITAEDCSRNHPCSTIVRCSGIYDEKRNPFLTYALSEREDGLDQYTNRVHKTDVARILFHIADTERQGVYLASDLNPITRRQFRHWVNGQKKVEASTGSYGKRCLPRRLVQDGFQFSYPDCRIP